MSNEPFPQVQILKIKDIMKSLISLLCAILIFTLSSCKSEKEREVEKLHNDLSIYYSENLKDNNTTIDKFVFVKMDSISQHTKLKGQYSYLNNDLEKLMDFYRNISDSLKLSAMQIKIYGILGSQELVDIEKEKVNKISDKSDKIKNEMDSLIYHLRKIELKLKKSDTIMPVGFQAVCYAELRNKDKSIKKDTVFILLDMHKDILSRIDFLKLPYVVNYDQFKEN